MSGWTVARAISGLLGVIGGILLILSWGMYLSLWSIIGLLIGGLGIFGGTLILRAQYVRGGTMAAAAAVVSWGLYPKVLLTDLLLVTVILMAVGGIMGLVLELTAD
jgi:hypothetical protein